MIELAYEVNAELQRGDCVKILHSFLAGCTPALYAVQGGCLTTLRFLVEKGKASLYAANNKGKWQKHKVTRSNDE